MILDGRRRPRAAGAGWVIFPSGLVNYTQAPRRQPAATGCDQVSGVADGAFLESVEASARDAANERMSLPPARSRAK
jgi:hypothetical protein